MEMETNISPFSKAFRPGAVQNSSATSSRVPLGPTMLQMPLNAITAGMASPLGAALQIFPPTVARP